MKYYIDQNNNYLGGSGDAPLSIYEVPFAPDDARQKWNGSGYDPVSTAILDAEKDAVAPDLLEPKKAFASVLEILWDNSAELRSAFPTKAALKQAAVAAYRAKL